ncbi:MAG: RNA pseudouridine synthase [Ramlibacter sp.]|nr:RNA pseudouridine synthase [Ramlibacter sp.]
MAETEAIRLAKRVAAQMQCSRREAELYIEGGWVRVDGKRVDEPQERVMPHQQVEIASGAKPELPEPVTLIVHKAAGVPYLEAPSLLSQQNHANPEGAGRNLTKRDFDKLESLMEMPAMAQGLAVYSQDFRIVRKLTEDAAVIEQEIIAEVSGKIAEGGLERLCHGLSVQGRPLPPIKVSWQNETKLRFAMKGIRPSQISWMCGQVGLKLVSLKRLRIGRVPMAGLAAGQWRFLEAGARF